MLRSSSVRLFALVLGCLAAAAFLRTNAIGEDSQVEKTRLLRHVVMFQFKQTSSDEEVQEVVDAFAKLPDAIPEIAAYEHGVNNSPEGLNDGLTHCFLVSFRSEEDRATYLPHPAHKAFVEILKPHLEKVVVIDYWTD
ncbi:MAG: Dabb family protein [Planctomycetota bacterium]